MKYRKKPVVIDAIQFDGSVESADKLEIWSGGKVEMYADGVPLKPFLKIKTLEGIMTAMPGDYIIKGIEGEFYPCKPGIFEQTYERVKK